VGKAKYVIKARHAASGRDECGDAQRVSGILREVSPPHPPQLRIIFPEYFCVVSDGTPSSTLPIFAYKSESVKEGDVVLQWMSRAQGPTILDCLRSRRDHGEKMSIVGEALHQFHSRGLAHGDLHFRNILFDEKSGVVILIDNGTMGEHGLSVCSMEFSQFRKNLFVIGVNFQSVISLCSGYRILEKPILIGRNCEILKRFIIKRNAVVEAIVFEEGSQLERIESNAFPGRVIGSIIIPQSVQILGERAFAGSAIQNFAFAPQSQLAEIGESCFREGRIDSPIIPRGVRCLRVGTFLSSKIRRIDFEHGSQLRDIEEAFAWSKIDGISFKNCHRLLCFENGCFKDCEFESLHFSQKVNYFVNDMFIVIKYNAFSFIRKMLTWRK
jgi:hypothetical protein